jgi:hypothetical protein
MIVIRSPGPSQTHTIAGGELLLVVVSLTLNDAKFPLWVSLHRLGPSTHWTTRPLPPRASIALICLHEPQPLSTDAHGHSDWFYAANFDKAGLNALT